MPRPEERDNYIFEKGRYSAKRIAFDINVTGILVRNKSTNKIEGILNEDNDYAELAFIDEKTIVKL